MDVSVETRILEAAFKVINKYTISGTRMRLISQECEMAQSNLHYHFKTKHDLLIALLDYIQDYFNLTRNEELEKCDKNLNGQLTGFFAQKKRLITEHPEYDRVQLDYWSMGQADPAIRTSIDKSYSIWRSHIADIIMLYAPTVKPEKAGMAARIMVSMMFGASFQYLCAETPFDLDEYCESCISMMEYYLNP